ncbi:chemotaxis protein CheW [Acidisoma sp. C75]
MPDEQARIEAILAARMAALAARGGRGRAAAADQPLRHLLLAEAGGMIAGIDLAAVEAVTPFLGCARLPNRQPACLGVIGRGGRFYSVLHLATLLGAASGGRDAAEGAGRGDARHLILLAQAAPALALAADTVLGRFSLPEGPAGLDFEGRPVTLLDLAAWRQRLGAVP